MTTKQIQLLLAYLGYDVAPDGISGPQTKAAVKEFQQDYGGISVDGDPGWQTQKALRDSVAYNKLRPAKKEEETQDAPADGPAWWKDIKYFKRTEPYISCPCGKCGGFPAEPSEKLMRLADKVREHFGKEMIPTSTVRCTSHNAKVNGVYNSRHLAGKAMDFTIPGFSASSVLPYVQSLGVRYAYAIDSSAVHMDVE